MSKVTEKLIKIVEKTASDQDAWSKAQQLLQQGADLKAPTKHGHMIHSVIAQEKRLRPVRPWEADNCLRSIQVLQNGASDQLVAQVLAENGGDLNEMNQLVQLQASCYLQDRFGPLGLLGSLLSQDKVPIRRDVVQFLAEKDPYVKLGWALVDNQQETCLSIAKKNSKCPQNVLEYIQNQFDIILNRIPSANPKINPNEVATWIRRGANIEATDEKGNTVLCNAVEANDLELVRVLVSLGSNTAHKNRAGLTPLLLAQKATLKNPPLIALLDTQSINVQLKNLIETKRSHLQIDEVENLLKKGVNINATFANNDSLLHILIANHGTAKMITAFVNDFNADISATNINGFRPIETCILQDKHPFDRLLAFFKLPKMTTALFINQKLNKTVLQFAIEQKRSEAAKAVQDELNRRLWNCMTRMNTKDENNKTIINEIKQLSDYGAQVNYKHQDSVYQEWTVLHLACKTTTRLTVQCIIESLKGDYMLQNHNGDYPISIAAEYGHLEIVEYLRGLPNVNLNVCNKDRQSPLHLATKNYHLLVVKYLVLWGADHQAQNVSKQTPLHIARANTAKTKDEEMNNKKVIEFFGQLVCPSVDPASKQLPSPRKPDYNLDTCELVTPVEIKTIQASTDDDEGKLGHGKNGIFMRTHNENLYKATKHGDVPAAAYAIGQGADIRSRRGGRTPYEVTQISIQECANTLSSPTLTWEKRSQLQNQFVGCQQIANIIRQLAQQKLIEAINQSNAGLVVAYHLAGAPLTADLLHKACNASDNVEIVNYLVNQSVEIYQFMINNPSPDSLYRIAKEKKHNSVATYLKYRLSEECTRAIKENKLAVVKKLVGDGASVEMNNTNNIQEALQHQNVEMIQFLCENGAKLPVEWLSAKTIILSSAASQQFTSEISFHINRCLINRRLRFAAASGDFNCVIQCQRLGADINSSNCHGSTALFCTIQYGNYFPIVHALVSCGASMLHSNEDEPSSLIDLAKKYNYKQIANFLSQELDAQFLTAVVNNDQQSAKKFSELGAKFNSRDEQKRTPLHYAVQHHRIDLVKWLCECGSSVTEPDINGDYPIMIATEEGDYKIVEFFVMNYSQTRTLTNKDGLTALQLAEKLGYKRIAELIRTGKPVEESVVKDDEPELTYEKLKEAARNGLVKIMKEFIEQRYESKEEKRKLCYELIQIAKKARHYEIVDILEPYYNTKLKTDLPSDMQAGTGITLSEHYKGVLLACLSGLSSVIAHSTVVLDPTDPNTYRDLFSGLASNIAKRSQEIQHVSNEQDAKKLIEQDSRDTMEQIAKINEQLKQQSEEKRSLLAHIEDLDQRLFHEQKSTALQRKQQLKEKEDSEKRLAGIECSLLLLQRQQEATLARQKTIKFIQDKSNLYMFYQTIERLLYALFISVLSAQGGYVKTEGTTLPFLDVLIPHVKSALRPILSKLDEKDQKQEWYNISTLGNIEEFSRIASDTAGMVTLYYREQIQVIDTHQKMKGSNIFNDKIKWLKDLLSGGRPESAEDTAIVMVGKYVTAWIIDALKTGNKNIIRTDPLPQQFWLHVARQNPAGQGSNTKVTDILGLSAGQQMIPLKFRNSFGKEDHQQVQLRYLIGCVSVVGNNGYIYQYPISDTSFAHEIRNLEIYGYVFITPFSSDEKVFHSIVEGRNLKPAKRDDFGNILTKFDDIIEHAQTYANQNHEYKNNISIPQETANQVAEILRQQKLFVNAQDVRNELKKTQEQIEISIDVLREEIEQKTKYYQTSIDAAHEQIKEESEKNRQAMQKDNETHYDRLWNKLNETIKGFKKDLYQQMEKCMNDISQEMRTKTEEILIVAKKAEVQSRQAIEEANQAAQSSQKAAQEASKAAINAQNLVRSNEERQKQFEFIASNCDTTVKQTVAALTASYERMIKETRTKYEDQIKQTNDTIREAVNNTKEAARAAKDSAISAQEVHRATAEQLKLQKKETEKILARVDEIRSQNKKASTENHDKHQNKTNF